MTQTFFNFFGVLGQKTAVQFCGNVLHIAILASLIKLSGQGHIQLEHLRLGRQHRKTVLADHQPQSPAIVLLNVKCSKIVNMFQRAHAVRLNGAGFIRTHFPQLHPAARGILLPQKRQPFFRDLFHCVVLLLPVFVGSPAPENKKPRFQMRNGAAGNRGLISSFAPFGSPPSFCGCKQYHIFRKNLSIF